MKRVVILFILAVTFSSAVLLASFITADRTKYKNNFFRVFPPHAAELDAVLKIDTKRFTISGLDEDCLYLRDRSARSGILITDKGLVDTTWLEFHIEPDAEVRIRSPYFFVQNGYNGFLQRGNIRDWSVDTTFETLPDFTILQPISPTTSVLRIVNMNSRKNLLTLSTSLDSPKDILKKQVDGILCTDGYLDYSEEYHWVVYTYRYRNQFLVLDTTLNVRHEGKTIDTTSVAKISVEESDGKITMSKPPLIVNKSTCVDGRFLFIYSNLVAKNESAGESKDRSVIDVYDLTDASYRFSFYINNIDGARMKNFTVRGTSLIAAFPGYIVRYVIQEEYLKE